jgi:hypothetical protein
LHKPKAIATTAVIKRLTGADLGATRAFLLKECFVPGKGFWSQYAGRGKISCSTTAICVYALSETGPLVDRQRHEFRRVLLAFRISEPADHAGAFPRTTGGAPSLWTTGQAVLALLSLGTAWDIVKPSVDWILRAQSRNGAWNYPGTEDGHERLIYTFYPAVVVGRCRSHIQEGAKDALTRVATFLESCEERHDAFWTPMRLHLHGLVTGFRRRRHPDVGALSAYWQLFEDGWPAHHVDENWLADRFSMALMCGPNYLHLRRLVRPDDPLALLHVRYLADDRVGSGWNDEHEQEPKTWATALGTLTLHRWAIDLARVRPALKRLPTRAELFSRLRNGTRSPHPASKAAQSLVRRFSQLQPGIRDATAYQTLTLDVFSFVFGDFLKDPRPQSATIFGTLRRDVTFRNAADSGPWADWKSRHGIESLLIECKNQAELSYGDLRQTACYLGKTMGRLGVLACRKTTADDVREMLIWFVNNDEKYILVVNDETLIDWIRLKDGSGDPTAAIADLCRSLREGVQ